MAVTTLLIVSMMGASAVSSEVTRWFPGDYFDSRVKAAFHADVMEGWPGPVQLMDLWNGGDLDESDRVSLLLGGAAFHDPVLLPAYREAVSSPSQRLRQAAVYGYRGLLGDGTPDVRGGISDGDAALIAEEMDLVMLTLDRRSLEELWVQALLVQGGSQLPGWQGITLQRPVTVSLLALERLVDVEDLDLLLVAYDNTVDFGTRVNLLKLIESVTLSRFIVMPTDTEEGWGRQVYLTAFGGLAGARRTWTRDGCTVDGASVLAENLRGMGVTSVDPLGVDGCGLWVGVLDQGFPQWWRLAARRLYGCGGPWVEISALSPERAPGPDRRSWLLDWYRPLFPRGPAPPSRR